MTASSTISAAGVEGRARLVLGIETSCDDTAAAVVRSDRRILAQAVVGQQSEHAPFGGVVPEIAARAHLLRLDRLVAQVMTECGIGFGDLAGIAATAGPGLIGGLVVGLVTAKTIALVHDRPLLAINHLEGHALTARLTHELPFPFLLLLVSGGHCQLQVVEGVGRYRRLGTTIDDALGEAFDKVAKLLDLPQPGGPAVERAARTGDPERFTLPRPLRGQPGCHFSYSGLKTAVRHLVQAEGDAARRPPLRDDICASFQAAAFEALLDRTARAAALYREAHPAGRHLVVAGGVAANRRLRADLEGLAARLGLTLVLPPPALCTDNAAMIAWAGIERLQAGLVDALDVPARARWPLDPHAEPALGAGVKA